MRKGRMDGVAVVLPDQGNAIRRAQKGAIYQSESIDLWFTSDEVSALI